MASKKKHLKVVPSTGQQQIVDVEADAPPFTERGLASLFAERHAHDLRYVAAWGKWFRWNGHKWEEEKTLYAFDLARALCGEQSLELAKAKQLAKDKDIKIPSHDLNSAKTVAAIVTLARADRRIAATTEQWDADPWLLNTPGGIVDLRTGEMRPCRPEDYCTKSTAVAPDANCPCPLWDAFHKTITNDDDLLAYKYRWYGYCLTGVTIEHALQFSWGTGRNGKGTEINTVAKIAGDYHRAVDSETFEATKYERHLSELAVLHRIRFVTSSESQEGRYWNEKRIKQVTGGDPITANFMRQDPFTFMPQFKPHFSGQHKPGLRNVNEALKARIHMVPYNVVVPEEERDKHLSEKLQKEWPGILHRIIQGCLDWQEKGLAPPKAVVDATAEYFETQDTFGNWLRECCIEGANKFAGSLALLASYNAWSTAGYPISLMALQKKLDDLGYKKGRAGSPKQVSGYWGLELKNQPSAKTEGDYDPQVPPQGELPYADEVPI